MQEEQVELSKATLKNSSKISAMLSLQDGPSVATEKVVREKINQTSLCSSIRLYFLSTCFLSKIPLVFVPKLKQIYRKRYSTMEGRHMYALN